MLEVTIKITMPEDGFLEYALTNGYEEFVEDPLTGEQAANEVSATEYAITALGQNMLQDYMIEKNAEAKAAAMNIVNQAQMDMSGAGIELVDIAPV